MQQPFQCIYKRRGHQTQIRSQINAIISVHLEKKKTPNTNTESGKCNHFSAFRKRGHRTLIRDQVNVTISVHLEKRGHQTQIRSQENATISVHLEKRNTKHKYGIR